MVHKPLQGPLVLFESFQFFAKVALQVVPVGFDFLPEPVPENEIEGSVFQTLEIDVRIASGDQVCFGRICQKGFDSALVDIEPERVFQLLRGSFPVGMLAKVQHVMLGVSGVVGHRGRGRVGRRNALLGPGVRGTQVRAKDLTPELDVSRQPPRVGVFVCNCGINIGGIADVPAVREYARKLSNVVHVEDNLFTCSQDTQDKMKEVINSKATP